MLFAKLCDDQLILWDILSDLKLHLGIGRYEVQHNIDAAIVVHKAYADCRPLTTVGDRFDDVCRAVTLPILLTHGLAPFEIHQWLQLKAQRPRCASAYISAL